MRCGPRFLRTLSLRSKSCVSVARPGFRRGDVQRGGTSASVVEAVRHTRSALVRELLDGSDSGEGSLTSIKDQTMPTAAEFMNKTFFHASPGDSVAVLLQEMAERGMGCVPVLDRARRPVGVATAGEIARHYDMNGLIERLDRPAVFMDQNTPIEVAARALVRH